MALIEVKDLCFAYETDRLAVKHVSFSVQEGMYVTIVGHNGSGKSTVAKLLAGLEPAKSGTITIDGLELTMKNLIEIRKRIGIVFQNPDNQFIGSTVRDDIAFGLENHCVDQKDMDPIIHAFSEKVGMKEFLEKEPARLSGGQKQRVAIAGVLAMKPKILIFDEATSMLDPQGKAEIKKVITDIHKESGLTILSITHDIDEVIHSDQVLAMADGELVSQGTPEELFSDKRNLAKIRLDLPFGLKLSRELRKRSVPVGESLDLAPVVEELCRLHSNM